ncbi:MAG: exodeoxyribonuclease VII large subunit, partial [Thermoplasmata archaeon]|nr:exodeoxyribonuclease VII large subunit [Thermoplasmata archaeon]
MASLLDVRLVEGRKVYTVFSITRRIRDDLEGDQDLNDIWVEGEISGFHHHLSSGHYYFDLKDENAKISCAAFRNTAANIPAMGQLKDGTKVLVKGDVSVYAPRGTYNIKVRDVKLLGRGDLYLLYEQLKKKLEQEGLFDPSRKKPLPRLPSTIGIVTSESGAAFQDILTVLSRRYPRAKIVISHARVQGEGAAENIVKALKALDEKKEVEVIIVGRGGGSMEDLWCFNDEQ